MHGYRYMAYVCMIGGYCSSISKHARDSEVNIKDKRNKHRRGKVGR